MKVKLNVYKILDRAVEEGLLYGIGRLFKYETGPFDELALRERVSTLHDAVMREIYEVMRHDDE